jgi:hypothetical protein
MPASTRPFMGVAYVTGLVNHELLLQNDCLAAENRNGNPNSPPIMPGIVPPLRA